VAVRRYFEIDLFYPSAKAGGFRARFFSKIARRRRLCRREKKCAAGRCAVAALRFGCCGFKPDATRKQVNAGEQRERFVYLRARKREPGSAARGRRLVADYAGLTRFILISRCGLRLVKRGKLGYT